MRFLYLLLIVIFMSGCTFQNIPDSIEIEEPLISESEVVGTKKYVIVESDIFLNPKLDSEKVNTLLLGSAVQIINSKDNWYYVEPLNIYRYDGVDTAGGWIDKSSLGYYKNLESNIGLDVLVKKGHEPEWSQEFEDGLWGVVSDESETHFSLNFYGASCDDISKENIEEFFHK